MFHFYFEKRGSVENPTFVKGSCLLIILLICSVQFQSFAQDDVTANYLTNAGFNTNCNYLSGDTGTVATANPANTHSVSGWSLVTADAWSAAATFEFGWNGDFNGVSTPASGADGSSGPGQGALGFTAGWGGDLAYSQQVTLPAGLYAIEFATTFLGSGNVAANLTGWVGNDGNVVLSDATSAAIGSWQTDTVSIRIVTETTGTIQVGMRPYSSSSTSNARMFVDYIKLISHPVDKVELQALVDSANAMITNPEPVPEGSTVYADLQTAVDNAQAVIDDGAATTETILQTEEAMKAAIADVHAAIFEASLVTHHNYTATFESLTDENIELSGKGQLTLTSSTDPIINSAINLVSPDAWVYFENMRPAQVINSQLSYVKVDLQDPVVGTNIRVTNYLNGAMVIAHPNTYKALTVFDGTNQSGDSLELMINQYYKTTELGSMADNIESFVLKRGYMATFASNEDGTGTSRVYIADDEDKVIDLMPAGLSNTASMVVVRQWRWTTKKGWRGGAYDAGRFNCGSYYDYNNTNYGTQDHEYVAMRHNPNWNSYGNFLDKFNSTHALFYNEPDNSVDDGFSSVADAIAAYPNMMASGLRLGSPATTDGGLSWLYDFMDQCDALGYRVDFVAWHFYRANYTAQQLYDQLLAIHNRTGRPLWITEFNNGCNWTYNGNEPSLEENAQVIQEFITMLESAPFVERYFVWDGCNETLRMTNSGTGELYPAGVAYRDQVSAMAYSADYYNDCDPATITPWVQINGGSWNATTDVVVNGGDEIRFGPQPLDGSWSWTGCGTSGSSREQVIYPTSSCSATATHTNGCGAQSSVTYNVTVSSANAAPTASFTFSTTNLTASFDASASSDSDGSIVSYDWDFGDGNAGTGQTTSHTYASNGNYTVTLTVTDDDNDTGTDQQTVSVSDGIASQVYVESIINGTANAGKGYKYGTAQITILDDLGGQVDGANVSGTFSGDYNESVSGVTGTNGVVSFQTTGTARGGVTVNFCVDNVTHSSLAYDPAQNQITCTGASARQGAEKELTGPDNGGIMAYPNPVKDKLHLSGIENIEELSIFSLAGKNMKGKFSREGQLIDVSRLAPGVYFLKLRFSDQQNLERRFVKTE